MCSMFKELRPMHEDKQLRTVNCWKNKGHLMPRKKLFFKLKSCFVFFSCSAKIAVIIFLKFLICRAKLIESRCKSAEQILTRNKFLKIENWRITRLLYKCNQFLSILNLSNSEYWSQKLTQRADVNPRTYVFPV